MAGPDDPYGPQDPGGPYEAHGPHGPRGASGQEGPFEPFEPMSGYGPTRQIPGSGDDSGTYIPEKRTNGFDHDRPTGRRPRRFSVVRLWAGGLAVAMVAALAAAVALLLVRGVLEIPVFAPLQEGTMVLASTGQLALGAALAALVATAVLQLLLLATPQPGRFLGWIITLGTVAAMLGPFTSDAGWEAKGGTAGVYLVIGLVIGTLMATVARSASRN